jgi:hypothetical protein
MQIEMWSKIHRLCSPAQAPCRPRDSLGRIQCHPKPIPSAPPSSRKCSRFGSTPSAHFWTKTNRYEQISTCGMQNYVPIWVAIDEFARVLIFNRVVEACGRHNAHLTGDFRRNNYDVVASHAKAFAEKSLQPIGYPPTSCINIFARAPSNCVCRYRFFASIVCIR